MVKIQRLVIGLATAMLGDCAAGTFRKATFWGSVANNGMGKISDNVVGSRINLSPSSSTVAQKTNGAVAKSYMEKSANYAAEAQAISPSNVRMEVDTKGRIKSSANNEGEVPSVSPSLARPAGNGNIEIFAEDADDAHAASPRLVRRAKEPDGIERYAKGRIEVDYASEAQAISPSIVRIEVDAKGNIRSSAYNESDAPSVSPSLVRTAEKANIEISAENVDDGHGASPTHVRRAKEVEGVDGYAKGRIEVWHLYLGRLRSRVRGFLTATFIFILFIMLVFGILVTLLSTQTARKEPASCQEEESDEPFVEYVEEEQLMPRVKRLVRRASAALEPLVESAISKLDELVLDPELEAKALEELIPKWDFETYDAEEQRTRRWQWCTDIEIQRLGLLIEAPTKTFEDYTRVYVNPVAKHVERLLEDAGVDLAKFDCDKNLESLLWQLLRAEAYFMMNASSTKLLLMVDTVRLRWKYKDHVLIQQTDDTFIGAKPSLPGIEKPSSESPTVAAKRMWCEIFKMPVDEVRFVADSMEDNEMEGYEGLRCVERTHFIEVKLLSDDLPVLHMAGLPMLTKFARQNSSEFGPVQHVLRNFEWMTEKMARSSGVHVPDFERTSSIDLRSDSMQHMSEVERIDQLRKFLNESSLDTRSWEGQGGSKNRLASLAKELAKGRSVVNRTSDGLHRVVSLVACRIRSPDGKLILVEKGRKYTSGEGTSFEEWKAQLPGAKKDNAETVLHVTRRICHLQLGWAEDDFNTSHEDSWEYYEYTEDSSRYKGLVTKYQKFFADAYLEDEEELLKRVGLHGRRRN